MKNLANSVCISPICTVIFNTAGPDFLVNINIYHHLVGFINTEIDGGVKIHHKGRQVPLHFT